MAIEGRLDRLATTLHIEEPLLAGARVDRDPVRLIVWTATATKLDLQDECAAHVCLKLNSERELRRDERDQVVELLGLELLHITHGALLVVGGCSPPYSAPATGPGTVCDMKLTIRRATGDDLADLQRLEHEHFPARPGNVHNGFLFDLEDASQLLTKPDDLDRWFTIVAEVDATIVGFALAIPSTRPGDAAEEPYVLLLQNMAVDDSYRLQGIGQALVREIERLAREAGQVLIQAHASIESAPFYQRLGWDVAGADSGIGWLIRGEVLGADFGHEDDGFPVMTSRVLEPDALLGTFHFKRRTTAPLADAGAELRRLVARGVFNRRDLHRWTIQILDFAEDRAKHTGAFGQKI